MKKVYCLIVILFSSIGVFAQNKTQFFRDSANVSYLRTSDINSSVVYLVNGQPSSNELIKLDSILIKNILSGDQLSGIYGDKKLDSVVIMLSKPYATAGYQKKFSTFSEAYKNYIKNYNDDLIFYTILDPQGNLTSFKGDELIRYLYNMPIASIESVSLMVKDTCCGTNRFVIIQTKQ